MFQFLFVVTCNYIFEVQVSPQVLVSFRCYTGSEEENLLKIVVFQFLFVVTFSSFPLCCQFSLVLVSFRCYTSQRKNKLKFLCFSFFSLLRHRLLSRLVFLKVLVSFRCYETIFTFISEQSSCFSFFSLLPNQPFSWRILVLSFSFFSLLHIQLL